MNSNTGRNVPVQLIRKTSVDDFNERMIGMLDQVEKRVEQLRLYFISYEAWIEKDKIKDSKVLIINWNYFISLNWQLKQKYFEIKLENNRKTFADEVKNIKVIIHPHSIIPLCQINLIIAEWKQRKKRKYIWIWVNFVSKLKQIKRRRKSLSNRVW